MTQPFGPVATGDGPASIGVTTPMTDLLPIVANRGRMYINGDWRLNVVGGNYQGTADEIDAGMALAMGVQQGQFKADPTLGNTIGQIKYLGGNKLHSDIVNRINTSNPTARYLANGDVAIVSIREEVKSGRLYVHVDYTKPKLGGPRKSAKYVPGGAPTDGQHNGITQNDGDMLVAANGEGVWL